MTSALVKDESMLTTYFYGSHSIYTVWVDNQPLFNSQDVCRALGYENTENGKKAVQRHVANRYKKEWRDITARVGKDLPFNMQPKSLFLTEEGIHELVLKSKMSKSIELAKQLGINIVNNKIISKEAETLSCILKSFNVENMKEQYTVDGYRIDLYFPIHKLAIECDELGHKDRDIGYEVTRQKYIETKLGCTFIRYNPDAKDFDIFSVINSIMKYILYKR